MNIFQSISLLWKTFTPLEDFLLNQFLSHADDELKNITEHQIKYITKAQRLFDWNEINYYCSKFDESFKYPNNDEIVLCVIDFRSKEINKKYIAKIYAVNGRLFSINVKPGVKEISFKDDLEIISFELVDNPMEYSGKSISKHLIKKLPDEYSKVEGTTLNNWKVKSIREIYSLMTEIGEMFCVAEKEESFLCVSIIQDKLNVYLFEDHDSKPILINKNLVEAIKSL